MSIHATDAMGGAGRPGGIFMPARVHRERVRPRKTRVLVDRELQVTERSDTSDSALF